MKLTFIRHTSVAVESGIAMAGAMLILLPHFPKRQSKFAKASKKNILTSYIPVLCLAAGNWPIFAVIHTH